MTTADWLLPSGLTLLIAFQIYRGSIIHLGRHFHDRPASQPVDRWEYPLYFWIWITVESLICVCWWYAAFV